MNKYCNQIELSVIVPCLNEEENVSRIVHQTIDLFNSDSIRGEIILINDGSIDNTKLEIDKLTKKFKNVVGIEHGQNLGIVESWHSGLEKTQGKHILTIDADLQYNPNDIIILYNEIKKADYDLVQGWRRKHKKREFLRLFLSKCLSLFLNMLFFDNLPDIKSGFVIYKRGVFTDILNDRKKFRTFQHFFIIAALKKGYKLKRVPITFYPRTRGKSFIKHPFFFSIKVLGDVPRAILEFGILSKRRLSEARHVWDSRTLG
ncbi:MAG: glycosyltransferase family 2 protein [Candidatus Atribacteria bacterium]|nr:glycosyltransferase family 2 protein [Candidatus Atribacteria bacterium]